MNRLEIQMLGETAADLIADLKLRKQLIAEADRRLRRKSSTRRLGYLLSSVMFAGIFSAYTWYNFGHGTFRIWPLLVTGVVLAFLGTLLELALVRVWRGKYLRELWTVMAEHGIPTCTQCGYSLAGTTEPRCPECGAAVTPASK
jgi:hypothetical protein